MTEVTGRVHTIERSREAFGSSQRDSIMAL